MAPNNPPQQARRHHIFGRRVSVCGYVHRRTLPDFATVAPLVLLGTGMNWTSIGLMVLHLLRGEALVPPLLVLLMALGGNGLYWGGALWWICGETPGLTTRIGSQQKGTV